MKYSLATAEAGCSSRHRYCDRPRLVADEYFIGAINRVGIEPLGDNDFYGQTYFVDPRGQLVGDAAADDKDEVVVRDLDMGLLAEVRDLWQFYRDRRPDAYGPLVQP